MTLIRRGAARKMPVASSDLKEKYEGRALGEALRRAEEAWIDSGFEMPREHLVQNA
jgi:poly(A) polymerase